MKNKETQIMSFEFLGSSYKFLMEHAMRAYRGNSIEEPYIESFMDAILPNLYNYIDTRANLEELVVSGTRHPMFKTDKPFAYKYELSYESAECYYYLQDQFDKLWVSGFLINIYQLRQETIVERRVEEKKGNGYLYKHPFNTDEWHEYIYENKLIRESSFFERNPSIISDGYVIDVNEPLETTIRRFMKLKEMK